MIYYIYLLISIILIYFIIKLLKFKNSNYIFLKVSFAILFLFLALRSVNVGTDIPTYKIFYDLCDVLSFEKLTNIFEIGFVIYNKIIFTITGGNFQIFLIITSFLCLYGIYNFIKENSSNYFLSVILFICLNYYFFMFSGLRQAIALSIALYSIKYVKKNESFKFILAIFIALLFHKTAFIFIIAYFLKKLNLKNKQFPLYLMLLAFSFIFRCRLVSLIENVFFTGYSSIESAGGGYTMLLVYLVILLAITLYKKNYIQIDSNGNFWYNLFCIGIIIQIFATVEGNAYRAAYYYVLPIIVMIPNFIKIFELKSRKICSLIILFVAISYFAMTLNGSTLCNEYSFFWISN